MITLDTELLNLDKYYYLFADGTNTNTSNNIDESSDAESTEETNNDGETSNVAFYQEVGYKADNLVEDLELDDPANRYAILKRMNRHDLESLMYKLDKEALVLGTKFFTKEKLMRFLKELPKGDLIAILKEIYTNDELLELMPMKNIANFLGSNKIDKNEILKYMKSMPDHELAKILEAAKGQPVGKMSHTQMLKQIDGLSPNQFVNGLTSMPYKKMLEMSQYLVNKDEELLKEFSQESLMLCFDKSTKAEINAGMVALEDDQLVKILQNLPKELMTQVVTQIEPEIFADVLLSYYTDLLSEILGQ